MREIFERAGCRGWVCAMEIDGSATVTLDADDTVVAASVIKVPIAVEFFRRVANGTLLARERVRLEPDDRTPGPTGFSTFADEVEVSLRDLARMMLVVSDNAATDVILHRVGIAAVNETMVALGLTGTAIGSDLRGIVESIGRDAGFASWDDLQEATGPDATAEFRAEVRRRLPSVGALAPARTTRTTPRDMATLLRLVWRDELVGPDELAGRDEGGAGAGTPVRELMAQQLTRHRLAAGFANDVAVAAKSGSLLGVVRNEIGVVEYPDGGRYAVAVFTRADEPMRGEQAINGAIGAAAAHAVGTLREPG
jgi:beta-lactamase class A